MTSTATVDGLRPLLRGSLVDNATYHILLFGTYGKPWIDITWDSHGSTTSYSSIGVVQSVGIESEIRFYFYVIAKREVGDSRKWLGRISISWVRTSLCL
jgi:hypothetical protein